MPTFPQPYVDNLIQLPSHYEIYNVLYDVLSQHHWRAIAIDPRVPHPTHNEFSAIIVLEYDNETLGISIRDIPAPRNTRLLFISEIQPKRKTLGFQVGDRIISVNDVQINDLASFGSIVKSAQINHGKLKIKVKNTGFLPFPEQGTTNWRKLDNYSFTSREIPIRSNVSTFNIAYCNPGVFIMKASNKRDQNSTTARIGDKVTEINQIRTQNMTRDEFDVQVNKTIYELYYTESNSVDLKILADRLSHPGVNWNKVELTGLRTRQHILFSREARAEKNQHYKRATSRYTAMSRSSDMSSRSNLSEDEQREAEFIDLQFTDNNTNGLNKEESEAIKMFDSFIDSELDGNDYETDQDNETRLAIKKTKAVYGKLNAATAHEEPKDTHKSNSDITTKKDAADLSNQKSSEKRQQKEQWFLSKLKESFPDETIRLSVPKSLRHTTDQSYKVYLTTSDNIQIQFDRNSDGIVIISGILGGTTFDLFAGDHVIELHTLKVKESNSSIESVRVIFQNWYKSKSYNLLIRVGRQKRTSF